MVNTPLPPARAGLEKIPGISYLARLVLSASNAPVALRNRRTNPAGARRERPNEPNGVPPPTPAGKIPNEPNSPAPGARRRTPNEPKRSCFFNALTFSGVRQRVLLAHRQGVVARARGERGACGSWINSPALDFRPPFGSAGVRTCEARRQVMAGTCFAVRATKRTQDIGLNQWVSDSAGAKLARHDPARRNAVRRERAMVAESWPTSAVQMPVMAQPEAVLVTAPAGARSCAAAWHGPRCGRPAARTRRARAAA